MSDGETTFIQKCLAGEALVDDIDDYVDRWHEGEGGAEVPLSEYLGFTGMEYQLWAEKPHLLTFILNARRKNVPLGNARDYDEPHRLAARDLSAEDAEELTQWLKTIGEIPS